MSYNIRDILARHGHATDDATLTRNLTAWQDDVMAALRSSGHGNDVGVRFGGSIPIHLLDTKQQSEFMGRYRDIIGLNTVLTELSGQGPNEINDVLSANQIHGNFNRRIGNIWSNLTGEKTLGSNRPYGRFKGTSDDSMISRIYSGINLQMMFRPQRPKAGFMGPGFGPHHFFGVGSIPRIENLGRSAENARDIAGKRLLVFDIETAGFRPGSIREIAYQSMRMGSGTRSAPGQILLRPGQGTRGRIVHGGMARPVDEFISRQFGLETSGIAAGHSGDDFIARVMPFLNEARNADRIVGHNIENFDIGQIFQGLAGTNRYKTDSGFRSFVDETYDQMRDKVVDTLQLARTAPNLAGLQASNLLSDATPYSIENLLMKTDLAKRIGIGNLAAAMGWDERLGGFTKGLHFGDVDTLVTAGLLEHMGDLQQVDLMDSGLLDAERNLAFEIQKQIQKSAAITPLTNIRNPENVHRRIRRMLGDDATINPIEQDVLLSRRLQYGLSGDVATEGVSSRKLLSTLGGFDRLIGRARGSTYADAYNAAKPSQRKFNAYRKALRGKGFGFAGLSYEERLFGTGLAQATSGIADEAFSGLARESLVSRFRTFDPSTMQYVTGSGKVTLPPQVLNHLGLMAKTDDPAMFSLSIVRPTAGSPSASVNLAYRFSNDTDLGNAVNLLEEMNRDGVERFSEVMGLDPDSATAKDAYRNFKKAIDQDKLLDHLRVSGIDMGVSTGQILGSDGADEVIKLLQAVNIDDRVADSSMLGFRLPFMNLETDAETGRGVIRTAGAVLDLGLTGEDRANIGRNVKLTELTYNPLATDAESPRGFSGMLQNPRMGSFARRISDAGSDEAAERFTRIFETVDQKIFPKLPKTLIGAAAVGIGAFLMHRKNEQDKYDVAFEYAGQEAGPSRYGLADVLEQRMLSGYNGYYRQVDPLATASLNENLYYSSVGHSNMSWDRNNAIYGGVL